MSVNRLRCWLLEPRWHYNTCVLSRFGNAAQTGVHDLAHDSFSFAGKAMLAHPSIKRSGHEAARCAKTAIP